MCREINVLKPRGRKILSVCQKLKQCVQRKEERGAEMGRGLKGCTKDVLKEQQGVIEGF